MTSLRAHSYYYHPVTVEGEMQQTATTVKSLRALSIMLLGFILLSACTPVPPTNPQSAEQSAASRFSGKTLLYYESSHGNQIEYYNPAGQSFLWYPGNRIAIPGRWQVDERGLCSQYGEDAYNPVTGEQGGNWSCIPLQELERDLVDAVSGDVFGLATGDIPFRLHRQPRFGSIAEVKAAP